MLNHRILLLNVLLTTMLAPSVAHAFILPNYQISLEEKNMQVEEALALHLGEQKLLAKKVNIHNLLEHNQNTKFRLTQKERQYAHLFEHNNIAIDFWRRTLDLKKSLLEIMQNDSRLQAEVEADAIAKSILSTLYRVSNEWKIGGSALFRNFLIRIGVKQKGFCYHYVKEMLADLSQIDLNYYDVHLGVAWKGGFRENNALIITEKGETLENGIAVDAWRTAGRPFWTHVKADRFPWEEEDIISNVNSVTNIKP